MGNDSFHNESEKVNNFIEIYKQLLNTLIYDKEYAEDVKLEDGIEELSAYQVKQKNIERAKKHKRGTSEIFSMMLSDELTSLGIENYLMMVKRYNETYWVNLYKDNEQFVVADITDDIIQRDFERERGANIDRMIFNSSRLSVEEFLLYNSECFVVEKIKDDEKRIEELSMSPLSSFGIEEDKAENPILVEPNILKRIINFVMDGMKKIITELGLEELFKPYEPPKQDEAQMEEVKEEADKLDLVPKVQIDEKVAIKSAEENGNKSEIGDKTRID